MHNQHFIEVKVKQKPPMVGRRRREDPSMKREKIPWEGEFSLRSDLISHQ